MTSTEVQRVTKTYDAYNSPRGLKEDAELKRVGRGTPVRRILSPFLAPDRLHVRRQRSAAEAAHPGEDFVLFRTGKGEVRPGRAALQRIVAPRWNTG